MHVSVPSTREVARLLRSEMMEVRGCTEPAAIAYAALTARRALGRPFRITKAHVIVEVSEAVYRNGSTAIVPVLKARGIPIAVLAGLYSRARGFNPFANISPAAFTHDLTNMDWIEVRQVDKPGIYIRLRLKMGAHSSSTTIAHRHDCVLSIARDVHLIYRKRPPKS